MTDKKYKSEAFEAIHSSSEALYKIKAIDKQTMRSWPYWYKGTKTATFCV